MIQKIISGNTGKLIIKEIKAAKCMQPPYRALPIQELNGLKLAAGDILSIKKSPVEEFMSYVKGFAKEGENFAPKSENPQSLFMEYFNYRKNVCIPKAATPKKPGAIFIISPKTEPKILMCKNEMISLQKFLSFVRNESKLATKEEYYAFVDEVADSMPEYVKRNYPMIRPEISENADKIFRWLHAVGTESKGKKAGELVYHRFFDAERKEKAIKEYVEFLENMTGKKVLVGSPIRMGFAVDTVSLFNNPEVYKDIDYILLGHGTGSSFADVTNPNTWRFTDTGESIWKFIESKIPKGKRVLVSCCEQDTEYWKSLGRIPQEYKGDFVGNNIKKKFPEMYDKNWQYMNGVGNPVSGFFDKDSGVKICESGKRNIIGSKYIKNKPVDLDGFVSGRIGEFETVYYDFK